MDSKAGSRSATPYAENADAPSRNDGPSAARHRRCRRAAAEGHVRDRSRSAGRVEKAFGDYERRTSPPGNSAPEISACNDRPWRRSTTALPTEMPYADIGVDLQAYLLACQFQLGALVIGHDDHLGSFAERAAAARSTVHPVTS